MTRPYAEVIGDPIAHSKSPLIHNFWLAKLGIDAEYRACHVRAEELQDYFTRRREDAKWRGCNVTIPHKMSVIRFADVNEGLDAGASNCVIPRNSALVATNTDGHGVLEALQTSYSPVCVIGAGGAAREAIATLELVCSQDFRIIARDREKALKGLESYEPAVFGFQDARSALSGAECVINASPLGMIGQPPMPAEVIVGLSAVDRDAVVFDMVYSPLRTPLLNGAERIGLQTVDGLVMLIGQAAVAFEHFFGLAAPREHDVELRGLLIA